MDNSLFTVMLAGAFRLRINGTPGVVDIPPQSPLRRGEERGDVGQGLSPA